MTTGDGHLFGPTTTFTPNGSVSQAGVGSSTIWDSSGNGQSFSAFDVLGLPVPSSDAKPVAPSAPPSISLPHDPNAPAEAPPAPTDTAPVPAPIDVVPAPAPIDVAPSLDSGSLDTGSVDSLSLGAGGMDAGGFDSGGGDGGD